MLKPAILATVFIRLMDALRTVDEVWMLTGGGPGAATRYVGLHIWRVVFPKTDYGYGAAMSLLTLYLTIVMCWLLYAGAGGAPRTAEGGVMRRRTAHAAASCFWIAASLVTLFPIYWMFVVSAKSRVELFGTPTFIIKMFYWKNYTNVLADPTFQQYMINSIIVATCNALLVTDAGAVRDLCAVALQARRQGEHLLLDHHQPHGAAGGVPAALFLLFTQVFVIGDWKLYDTRIGLILLYCVFNLPFAIWTLRSVIDGIPKELDEAAMIDGATPGRS